jgi:hypothetical protein
MTSSHYSYIDARGSEFHSVAHNQNNFHITNIFLESAQARHSVEKRPCDDDANNGSMNGDDVLLRVHERPNSSHSTPACSPDNLQWSTGSAGAVADSLILKIVRLLMNRGETSSDYQILELELEPLRQTITLANHAVQACKHTPLDQNLENSIIPEVAQICLDLQELLDRINGYRRGLWLTSIRDLWRKVWYRSREVDDRLASLRTKLAARQKLLGRFLMALNLWVYPSFTNTHAHVGPRTGSVLWMELGNGVRTGHVSLKYFHTRFKQGPLSLHHIQDEKIMVVDHLGQNIPVPILFCSTWTVLSSIFVSVRSLISAR